MAITLTRLATGDVLALSDRLQWTDEYKQWRRATQTITGTNGALHMHERLRLAGRAITLDGRDSQAWTTREDYQQMQAWAELPGETFALLLRGTVRSVAFHSPNGPSVDAYDLWKLVDGEYTPSEIVRPIYSFIEV